MCVFLIYIIIYNYYTQYTHILTKTIILQAISCYAALSLQYFTLSICVPSFGFSSSGQLQKLLKCVTQCWGTIE